MLVLTRRVGEGLRIRLAPGVSGTLTVEELFADGPIEVVVLGVRGNQVKIGIQADKRLVILREELCEGDRRFPVRERRR